MELISWKYLNDFKHLNSLFLLIFKHLDNSGIGGATLCCAQIFDGNSTSSFKIPDNSTLFDWHVDGVDSVQFASLLGCKSCKN